MLYLDLDDEQAIARLPGSREGTAICMTSPATSPPIQIDPPAWLPEELSTTPTREEPRPVPERST
jgi:hypothetical protein